MYLLADLSNKCVFQNGGGLDCTACFPAAPPEADGVAQIRVLADGTIERYSATDWAWKPAPGLAGYVDSLRAAHVDTAAALAAADVAAALKVPAPKSMPVTTP